MNDPRQEPEPILVERPEALPSYYGPTNFTWLVRGCVAGSPCPGVTQSLETDLEAFKRVGITTVVTLTEEWVPPVERFAAFGLKSIYVPVPDMDAPTIAQATDICRRVAQALSTGESVVFHCRAGRGRTGTLLAALLIWLKPDFDAAVSRIKATNRYWIESRTQMEFLKRFAASCSRNGGHDFLLCLQDLPENANLLGRFGLQSSAEGGRKDRVSGTAGRQRELTEKEQEMSLDKALQSAMATVPECLASGYVDMETGMLIGIQTIDSHPQEVLDTLAAATADLFQGSAVTFIEDIFKKARGTKSDGHYFNEFLIFSDNLIHVFMRSKKYGNHVCCFVCRKTANPGMVLTKARMSMDNVAAAV